jgi:phospholipid/cholesterol/gamma-HCH transport system permease protein
MNLFSRPLAALISFGEATRFCGRIVMKVFNGRVLGFIGETLRQAGILITGSAVIVLGLVFILGLQCGIEGAYAAKSVGATSSTGAIAALCDLREVIPYAFGYMMAAKVGTGFVAEIGSMRISDEIDALEVMGFDSILYLGSTRLLGTCWSCRSST